MVMGLWGKVMCCRVWRLSLVWAQEGARHTSEMPTWRSKRVCWCSWMALDWELRLLPLVELALLTDLAGWVGWGLHGFWPGIDESTPDKGRTRQGKAGQGSWKNLYTLTGPWPGAWDKGRGRKRWKVSKPISSSSFILKALLSEHFTPNRLVGYICIRQTSCCNWSKYLPGTVSFYILMVEGWVKIFWHSQTNPLGKAPKHLVHCCFKASRLQIAVILCFCFLNSLLVGLWR